MLRSLFDCGCDREPAGRIAGCRISLGSIIGANQPQHGGINAGTSTGAVSGWMLPMRVDTASGSCERPDSTIVVAGSIVILLEEQMYPSLPGSKFKLQA